MYWSEVINLSFIRLSAEPKASIPEIQSRDSHRSARSALDPSKRHHFLNLSIIPTSREPTEVVALQRQTTSPAQILKFRIYRHQRRRQQCVQCRRKSSVKSREQNEKAEEKKITNWHFMETNRSVVWTCQLWTYHVHTKESRKIPA